MTAEEKEQLKCEKTKIAEASGEIEHWTNEIVATRRFSNKNATFFGAVVEKSDNKHASLCYQARKVTMKLGYRDQDGDHMEEWKVNFDLDPYCIELQTEPVTYAFYDRYKEIINRLLFRRDTCRPYPDEEMGGGGHISLDLVTAFDNNPQYLANFLVIYAVLGNDVKYKDHILRNCKDVINAPFMNEIGELDEFIRVIREFNSLAPDKATMERLVNDINTRVYTRASEGLCAMDVLEEDYPHYQAVNLENVLNPDITQRRVELRRFEAQQNIFELLLELQELYKLLDKSRRGIKLGLKDDGTLMRIP